MSHLASGKVAFTSPRDAQRICLSLSSSTIPLCFIDHGHILRRSHCFSKVKPRTVVWAQPALNWSGTVAKWVGLLCGWLSYAGIVWKQCCDDNRWWNLGQVFAGWWGVQVWFVLLEYSSWTFLQAPLKLVVCRKIQKMVATFFWTVDCNHCVLCKTWGVQSAFRVRNMQQCSRHTRQLH